MTKEKLALAKKEAKELLQRIDVLEKEQKAWADKGHQWALGFPKETGSIKRQSMELTRALADLRRP